MNKMINNLKKLPIQGQFGKSSFKKSKKNKQNTFLQEKINEAKKAQAELNIAQGVPGANAALQKIKSQIAAQTKKVQQKLIQGAKLKKGFEAPSPIELGGPVQVEDPITGGAIAEETIASIQAEAVADYIQQQENLSAITNGGKTFQTFNIDDINSDIIDATKETVTAGLWSDNLVELANYFTQSMNASQRQYYVNVLQKAEGTTGSAIQYAVAYGNRLGSGSGTALSLDDSPSRAIYSQYSQLLLPNDQQIFSDPGSGSTNSIYALNFQRNRTKDKLDPGNFELPLIGINSRASDATGSIVCGIESGSITLIDDSSIASASNEEAGNVYHLVSGSINLGVFNPTAPHYYGSVYVDHSTIILNGDTLDNALGFRTNTGSNSIGNNHYALHAAISASYSGSANGFKARNKETVSSTFYFVRVKNGDFNYSNNPSYITGSEGDLLQDEFIGDPKSYITTVGLYNESRELLAIAKLSKPLLKSKKRELNIRVKLEY